MAISEIHETFIPLISVIVPVYNTEKYIARCIDSILAQSYQDFELVLVDDGSPDHAGAICDEYAEENKKVRVLHLQNGGASNARLNGFKASRGEWITFVDSDDTLPKDTLMHYSKHFDDDTDIIIGWLNDFRYKEKSLTVEEYRRRNIGRCGIVVGPPTHTFRRNIISEEVFNIPRDIVFGEDMLMNIRLAFRTEKPVSITHHVVYNYDVSENIGNATNTFKTTMEYEYRYHQLRLESIPAEFHQTYMKEMINVRAYDLFRYVDNHPFDRLWKKTDFFKELMSDIEWEGWMVNRANMELLYSNNVFMQCAMILYKRMITYMQKWKRRNG